MKNSHKCFRKVPSTEKAARKSTFYLPEQCSGNCLISRYIIQKVKTKTAAAGGRSPDNTWVHTCTVLSPVVNFSISPGICRCRANARVKKTDKRLTTFIICWTVLDVHRLGQFLAATHTLKSHLFVHKSSHSSEKVKRRL